MNIDSNMIEDYRERIREVDKQLSDKKAKLSLLKSELKKKKDILKETFGLSGDDAFSVKLKEFEDKKKMLMQKIEGMLENAERLIGS